MLFNPVARLSTAVILLRHPGTSADMAVWEFRTLAHLNSAALPHEKISTAMVLLITSFIIPPAERQPYLVSEQHVYLIGGGYGPSLAGWVGSS